LGQLVKSCNPTRSVHPIGSDHSTRSVHAIGSVRPDHLTRSG